MKRMLYEIMKWDYESSYIPSKKTPSVTTTLHSKNNKRYIWNNETISLLDTNFQTCSKLTSFSFPLKVLQRVFQR